MHMKTYIMPRVGAVWIHTIYRSNTHHHSDSIKRHKKTAYISPLVFVVSGRLELWSSSFGPWVFDANSSNPISDLLLDGDRDTFRGIRIETSRFSWTSWHGQGGQKKDDEGLLPVKGMVKFDAGSGFPREGILQVFSFEPLMVQILGILSGTTPIPSELLSWQCHPLLLTQRCGVDF